MTPTIDKLSDSSVIIGREHQRQSTTSAKTMRCLIALLRISSCRSLTSSRRRQQINSDWNGAKVPPLFRMMLCTVNGAGDNFQVSRAYYLGEVGSPFSFAILLC